MTMWFIDLFAGIGGFSLGLERAGLTCVGQVEIDPFCQKVLAKHWPHVKRISDIREVRGDEFGPAELICGGPPCQPASLAGKRRGEKDDRWLWPEAIRLVGEIRPAWCLFENPPGILTMGLDGMLAALENLGYSTRPLVIPACAVDSPHGRSRVWIVGHATRECGDGGGQSRTTGWNESTEPIGDVGHSNSAGLEKRPEPEIKRRNLRDEGQTITASSLRGYWADSEWLLCREPDGEIVQRRVKLGLQLLVDGLPGRMAEIRGFGNAVVPQIPEIVGRAIMQAEGR
jgi:DNA (cytosine-5)-methyltransferase 1